MTVRNKSKFAKRFADVRRSAGFRNAADLANKMGIKPTYLQNIESGRKANFDVYVLLEACRATGKPITEFIPEIVDYLPENLVDSDKFFAEIRSKLKP